MSIIADSTVRVARRISQRRWRWRWRRSVVTANTALFRVHRSPVGER